MAENDEAMCRMVQIIIMQSFDDQDPDLPKNTVEEKKVAREHVAKCKECSDFYELVIELRSDHRVNPQHIAIDLV